MKFGFHSRGSKSTKLSDMKVGILGGGFALYGYLPAFIELEYEVFTLARYKPLIENRPELKGYFQYINFVNEEVELLDLSQVIVLARTPLQQFNFIENNSFQGKRVFLEKPLAADVSSHAAVLDLLNINQVNFSIGYIFHLTEWFLQISSMLNIGKVHFLLEWELPAPPTSWKSEITEGGGLGSYYAVHFVPVLMLLGFEYGLVVRQGGDEIVFNGTGINDSSIKVVIVFGSKNFFKVSSTVSNESTRILFASTSPVGNRSSIGSRDSRVNLLKSYITSTIFQESNSYFVNLEKEIIKFRLLLKQESHDGEFSP